MQTNFSDYIVYVDESGDHSLESVDQGYPVFVLSLCVFHKGYYSSSVIPALESFKFKHFGHDCIILHENEIRKQKGAFVTLSNQAIRSAFLEELTVIIEQSKFVLISCLIDKQNLKVSSAHTDNPYHIALGICLDALYEFLSEKKQQDRVTHVVVECRGKKEDQELELEFRRVCDGNNRLNQQLPFNIIFADKKTNSTGLQLADLVARPIGVNYLRPEQKNRAFDVLKHKLYCSGGRLKTGEGYDGWGMRIYPAPKSEKPR